MLESILDNITCLITSADIESVKLGLGLIIETDFEGCDYDDVSYIKKLASTILQEEKYDNLLYLIILKCWLGRIYPYDARTINY